MNAEAGMVPKLRWTDEDALESVSHGWSIFEIAGRDPRTEAQIVNGQPYGHRPFELQAVLDVGIFGDDAEAWAFVRAQAEAGDALALCAAAFLRTNSPREYEAVFGAPAMPTA